MTDPIPPEYQGWWRIVDTSQWMNEGLDDLGAPVFSITGAHDRMRMHCLIADVSWTPAETGIAFTWTGAWEYDEMSGTGHVTLGQDGQLEGTLRIENGDSSAFTAVRSEPPDDPLPPPPRARDKWRRSR